MMFLKCLQVIFVHFFYKETDFNRLERLKEKTGEWFCVLIHTGAWTLLLGSCLEMVFIFTVEL